MQRNIVIMYEAKQHCLEIIKVFILTFDCTSAWWSIAIDPALRNAQDTRLGLITWCVCDQTGLQETSSHKTETNHAQNKTKHHNSS